MPVRTRTRGPRKGRKYPVRIVYNDGSSRTVGSRTRKHIDRKETGQNIVGEKDVRYFPDSTRTEKKSRKTGWTPFGTNDERYLS